MLLQYNMLKYKQNLNSVLGGTKQNQSHPNAKSVGMTKKEDQKMATVKLYVQEVERDQTTRWREAGKTESDEIDGFLDKDFDNIEKQGGVWLISFRETFYSSAKRIPGIYWERCNYCGMPMVAPMVKIVLEETGENTYRVRIHGHRWHCVKQEYDRLRQGRLFPKVRWDLPQVKSADQDEKERHEGAYPNISCSL